MRIPALLSSLVSLIVFCIFCFGASVQAQSVGSNEWTWVAGSNLPNNAGSYGTLGIAAAGNMPGGRQNATSWVDAQGNIWIFGGFGVDSRGFLGVGLLNDLWEFSPSTNQWRWVGGATTIPYGGGARGQYGTLGTPGQNNQPGGRQLGVGWIDKQGNLWLFGGDGIDSAGLQGALNDLWEFNTTTAQWAWMGGSDTVPSFATGQPGVYGTQGVPSVTSIPGGRTGASSWTDANGNFWLFGGGGSAQTGAGDLNDLWEFQPSTLSWTWVGGSNTANPPGIYGSLGSPSPMNVPGGRSEATQWVDGSGNFWLFGGNGIASLAGENGDLNDVWRYSPSANEWTWMGGTNTIANATPGNGFTPAGVAGVYGVLGTPSPTNIPGSRLNAAAWTDGQGALWMLGGQGYEAGDSGMPDDLWVLNPVDDEWAWMNGSSSILNGGDTLPAYGTLGVPSTTNYPGSRSGSSTWKDAAGNLWLFGGCATASGGNETCYDDIWRFSPAAPAVPPFFALSAVPGVVTAIQGATAQNLRASISLAVTGGFNQNVALAVTGLPPGVTASFTPATVAFPASSTLTFTTDTTAATGSYPITVTGTGGALSEATNVTLNVTAPSAPVFNPPPGNYSAAQSVTISDSVPGAMIYYTTDETVPTSGSNLYTGAINVASTAHLEAIAIASGYPDSPVAVATYDIGASSPIGEWSWMSGSSVANSPGSYGVLGAPNPSVVPASRTDAVHWTDPNGNLWIFGGSYNLSNVGAYNDLWRFIPSINQWAWVGGDSAASDSKCASIYGCGKPGIYGTIGQASPANRPSARSGAASWVDQQGNLWMFGGLGYDIKDLFGLLSDLWEYVPSQGEWIWMGGNTTGVISYGSTGNAGVYGTLGVAAATNNPGSRRDAATWVDQQGNFWMFGGQGDDSIGDAQFLNDLWEFNPSTRLWTWVGGPNLIDQRGYNNGVYGTEGVPAVANIPGSRLQAATWSDSSGNFWLFGGTSGDAHYFNDLWRYTPSTNEWTWMNGASVLFCLPDPLIQGNLASPLNACGRQPATLGTLGVALPANVPAGGAGFANWTDKNGNFWLMGGNGSDSTGQNNGFYLGQLNALWTYNPATNQWTWMGGDAATSDCSFDIISAGLANVICDGNQGVFGAEGVPGPANIPSARTTPASWTDANGNFWLFAGGVNLTSDLPAFMNDLWEYQPPTTSTPATSVLPAATTPIFSLKAGNYFSGGPLSLSNGMTNATIHYTTDGSTPTFASPVYSAALTLASTETVTAFATALGYRDSPVASATYTFVGPLTPPTFSVPSGTYKAKQILAINESNPLATIYYTLDGRPPTNYSNLYIDPITVDTSETVSAVALVNGYGTLDAIATIALESSAISSATYQLGQPVAPVVALTPSMTSLTTAQALTVGVSVSGPSSSGTATGSIILTGGGYTSSVVPLAGGNSSFSIPPGALAIGYDTLTATYTPDATAAMLYNSASGSAKIMVSAPTQPGFTLSGTSVSVSPGSTTGNTSTILVTPSGGFTGSVILTATITSSPAGAANPPTLSFGSTSPVSIASSSPGTASLSILTTAPATAAVVPRKASHPFGLVQYATLALVFFGCSPKVYRRRRWCVPLAALAFLAGALGMSGCGSGSTQPLVTSPVPGTSPGVYQIIVTATSASIHATSNITATVL